MANCGLQVTFETSFTGTFLYDCLGKLKKSVSETTDSTLKSEPRLFCNSFLISLLLTPKRSPPSPAGLRYWESRLISIPLPFILCCMIEKPEVRPLMITELRDTELLLRPTRFVVRFTLYSKTEEYSSESLYILHIKKAKRREKTSTNKSPPLFL